MIESWRRHYNAVRPHESLATGLLRLKSSCQRLPRGRLRALVRSHDHALAGVETWAKLTLSRTTRRGLINFLIFASSRTRRPAMRVP